MRRYVVRHTPMLLCAALLGACGGAPTSSAPGSNASQAQSAPQAAGQPLPAQAGSPPVGKPDPAAEAAAPAAPADAALLPTPAPQDDQGPTPDPAQPDAPNPFVETAADPLSTFAMDVDTASYSSARNAINSGQLPQPGAVRVEEFVNYFDYSYPKPQDGAFGILVDAVPSPLGSTNTQIVRVGVQGRVIDASQRKPASLVFVIDVSSSMQEPNRLPLVKQALGLLVDELREGDQVAIVVYGSQARTVLNMTSATSRDTIMSAINSLSDEGSTNAEAGIKLGYQVASGAFLNGGINRVILCSDGVANVGATGPDGIRQQIKDYTAQGVYLTTVGFGLGDYNDTLMEQLADDGDGNYAYVDTIDEAQRVFSENLTGTLQVIAKDAKVQVEFNPAVVSRYRLLGYENRAVADADFRNDQVDAGEVGAGHSVTALYEVALTEQGSGTALTVRMRYADPEGGGVREQSQALGSDAMGGTWQAAAPQLQLAVAVASFAEQLRGSAKGYTMADVLPLARQAVSGLPNDADAQEFAQLVERASGLAMR